MSAWLLYSFNACHYVRSTCLHTAKRWVWSRVSMGQLWARQRTWHVLDAQSMSGESNGIGPLLQAMTLVPPAVWMHTAGKEPSSSFPVEAGPEHTYTPLCIWKSCPNLYKQFQSLFLFLSLPTSLISNPSNSTYTWVSQSSHREK